MADSKSHWLSLDILSELSLYVPKRDLRNLAVTSREIEFLTRHLLYSDVYLTRDWQQVAQFCSCLKNRPTLSSAVKCLRIHFSDIWYLGFPDTREPSEAEQQDLILILSLLSPTLRQLYLGPSAEETSIKGLSGTVTSCPAIDAIFTTIRTAPSLTLLSFERLDFPHEVELANILNQRKSMHFMRVSGSSFEFTWNKLSDGIVLPLEELTVDGTCGALILAISDLCEDARFQKSQKLKKLKISLHSRFFVKGNLGATFTLNLLRFKKIQHMTLFFDYDYLGFGFTSQTDHGISFAHNFITEDLMLDNGSQSPLITLKIIFKYSSPDWDAVMTENGSRFGKLLEEMFTSQRFPSLQLVTLSLQYPQSDHYLQILDSEIKDTVIHHVQGAAPSLSEAEKLQIDIEPSLESDDS